LKAREVNRRINGLSEKFKDVSCGGIRIDFDSFPENEKQLLRKALLIGEEYGPNPPKELLEENSEFFYKGLEVIARRVIDLFVETIPNTLLCDEVEQWYFKLHFYNFLADFGEVLKRVRNWPEKEKERFLRDMRETGMVDSYFRFRRGPMEEDSVKRRRRGKGQ
jgi:hypothetical protein